MDSAQPPDRSPLPFAELTPDTVLNTVEALGIDADGRLMALNSYENRVFLVGLDDGSSVVAKFYRPGRWSDAQILEEHDFAARLNEAEIPVAAPLSFAGETLLEHQGYPFAIWQSVGGRQFEVDNLDQLEWVGRYLGRIHSVGASHSFHHRVQLDVESMLHEPRQLLAAGEWLPSGLAKSFFGVLDELIKHVSDAMTLDVAQISLHGDCHPGNILWRDDQAHFVDLDDALAGPAVQDLWMLAGRREDGAAGWRWLLEGYGEFRAFDRAELHLVEALRALRLLHYNAWIARRWHDPAFPAAFPWFEAPRHWESVITQMQEQLAALHEPPPEPA